MGGDGAFWGLEKGTSGMEVNMSCGMGWCGRDRCCWRLRRRSLGGSAIAADLPAALDVGWNRGVDKSGMGKTEGAESTAEEEEAEAEELLKGL